MSDVTVRRLGMGTAASFTYTAVSAERPRSIIYGDAMLVREHGVAVMDSMVATFHQSATGRRKTPITLMTLPSAVAALQVSEEW